MIRSKEVVRIDRATRERAQRQTFDALKKLAGKLSVEQALSFAAHLISVNVAANDDLKREQRKLKLQAIWQTYLPHLAFTSAGMEIARIWRTVSIDSQYAEASAEFILQQMLSEGTRPLSFRSIQALLGDNEFINDRRKSWAERRHKKSSLTVDT